MDSLESGIGELNTALEEAQKPIIERLQALLAAAEGKTFKTFEEKQRVAAMIQEIISRLGMALECPNPECRQPAKLRCKKSGRSKSGKFVFEHYQNGHQIFHGGLSVLPSIRLTQAF